MSNFFALYFFNPFFKLSISHNKNIKGSDCVPILNFFNEESVTACKN